MKNTEVASRESEKRLPILGHLAELRTRLIKSLIAIVISTVVAFVFWQQVFGILIHPAGDIKLIYTEVTEGIGTMFRVCLTAGIMLAMPYITYQFMMFVSPGLTNKERRYVYLILPWIAAMFAGGVVFGYFVLLPPALRMLLNVLGPIAEAQIRIGNYVAVVTRMLIAIGLVFETPVVTTFLARIGIIDGRWLASKRKFALVGAFVLGAIITPTFDPINQTLVAAPLIVLYEMSIWLARVFGRKRRQAAGTS